MSVCKSFSHVQLFKTSSFYSTIMFLKTFNKLANKLFTKKLIQATFNLESPVDKQNETSKKSSPFYVLAEQAILLPTIEYRHNFNSH